MSVVLEQKYAQSFFFFIFIFKNQVASVVREQKYNKCQKAIEMLFTMSFYMQQAKWLKEQVLPTLAWDLGSKCSSV